MTAAVFVCWEGESSSIIISGFRCTRCFHQHDNSALDQVLAVPGTLVSHCIRKLCFSQGITIDTRQFVVKNLTGEGLDRAMHPRHVDHDPRNGEGVEKLRDANHTGRVDGLLDNSGVYRTVDKIGGGFVDGVRGATS